MRNLQKSIAVKVYIILIISHHSFAKGILFFRYLQNTYLVEVLVEGRKISFIFDIWLTLEEVAGWFPVRM